MDSSLVETHPDFCSQKRCYELMVKRMVSHVFQGYSTCLFCYGQTGTGKTTTIMGKMDEPEDYGVLLRLLNDVFTEADSQREESGCTIHLKVQMLEVYNEK